MKKVTLILLLNYIIFANCHAQKFIDQTKVWIVATEVLSNYHYGPPKSQYYKFIGDTLVNDKIYAKMYFSTNIDQSKWRLNSLWREDALGRVFLRSFTVWGNETLLYDFNLHVGDTLRSYSEMILDSIVSKPFGSQNRKHYYFHRMINPLYITTWVEGVGSVFNPTWNNDYDITGGKSTLICFEENGALIYHNPNYPNCFFTSIQSLEDDQNFIDLFSMQNGEIQIRLKSNTNGKLFLYTLDGKQVLNKELSLSTTTICAPTRGILLYRFIGKDGEVQTGKVMVK